MRSCTNRAVSGMTLRGIFKKSELMTVIHEYLEKDEY
jgi:hypothetical protein